jgi:RibD C-terminal domain
MPRLTLDISMSLDGFVAGPNANLEQPPGAGGDRFHEWAFPLAAWREPHGLTGGAVNRDSEVFDEAIESTGAYHGVAGGADVAQQYLRAGLLDELQVHVAALLLGDCDRLFDLGGEPIQLECTRVIESPAVTHLKYRVVT